jgi:hypothetical protein
MTLVLDSSMPKILINEFIIILVDKINVCDRDLKIYIYYNSIEMEAYKCPTCKETTQKDKGMMKFTFGVKNDCINCLNECDKFAILNCGHINICDQCYEEEKAEIPKQDTQIHDKLDKLEEVLLKLADTVSKQTKSGKRLEIELLTDDEKRLVRFQDYLISHEILTPKINNYGGSFISNDLYSINMQKFTDYKRFDDYRRLIRGMDQLQKIFSHDNQVHNLAYVLLHLMDNVTIRDQCSF